jgi:hypothetical protein
VRPCDGLRIAHRDEGGGRVPTRLRSDLDRFCRIPLAPVREGLDHSCCTLPAAPRCSYKMYGEGLMASGTQRLCPVLTAVSPSIVPAALRKSTLSVAPARPCTHAPATRHRDVSCVSNQINVETFVFRSFCKVKYQWEVGNTGSQHASRA